MKTASINGTDLTRFKVVWQAQNGRQQSLLDNSLNILNFSRIRQAPENSLLINLMCCNLAWSI